MRKTDRFRMQTGVQVGRWTVMDETQRNNNGERLHLCRCACGTERFVLDRSLLSGTSTSCGCARKRSMRSVDVFTLLGQRFGELTVLSLYLDENNDRGDLKCHCRCECGNECDVRPEQLLDKKKTNCGGVKHRRNAITDIRGRKFSYLTALYPTQQRTETGSVIWHCRCDCGKEVDVSYNTLMWTHNKSCGCKKLEHDQAMPQQLTHVAGTCVDILKSKKVPKNNTTGVKGVYRVNNRYIAKIVFQRKQYQLGTYDSIEEAGKARREAEISINETFVRYYEKWNELAARDPVWAQNNPIRLSVQKDGQIVKLSFLPEIAL